MTAFNGISSGTSGWDKSIRSGTEANRAARQFEAMLLDDVLSKLRQSMVGETQGEDPGCETMVSIADHALSETIVNQGGIGFSRMLHRALREKQT